MATFSISANQPIARDGGLCDRVWYTWFQQITKAVPTSGAAPADSVYVLGSADALLPDGRVVTNTATVTWDQSVAGQIKANTVNMAPADAQYLVATANATLTAERVATDTATVAWDFGTAAQAKASVVDGSISNAKLRSSVGTSVIGRSANSTGSPADIQTTIDNQVLVRRSSVLVALADQLIGYWSILTDPIGPTVVFTSGGDVVAVWTAL